jgi:RNA polymerase sigma-70 factor (ECF subfamily)
MKPPPSPTPAAAPRHAAPRSASRRPLSAAREERRAASKREAEYDAQLVERARSGDAGAFSEIVQRYRDKMFSVALSLLRDRHDAEEIVQDTFIRAHRGLARFRGDCSLATWLHRITVNLARNRYWFFHRRARHATLSLDCPLTHESDATFGDLLPADIAGPAREAATAEFLELVTNCMDRLHSSHREILTLRNILNQSYAEIAAALGIEEGTVKSRIARARGCLRSLMAETCPEFATATDPADWLELNHPTMRSEFAPAV